MRIALALALLAPLGVTDTIHLSDGRVLADVEVQDEGLTKVTYKEGRRDAEVNSEDVLRVTFERMPKPVSQAEGAAIDESYEEAIAYLEDYIAGVVGKPQRKMAWAPAYAMYRVVEIHELLGNRGEVVKAADRLIEHAAESRYVPLAFLKKAQALADQDKSKSALGVVEELGGVIDSKALGERWRLEQGLAKVLFDGDLSSAKKIGELERVASAAGAEYPVVRNRAKVGIGEEHLNGKDLAKALGVFREILDDPKADDTTLAAAHTGLGECLYTQADSAGDKDKMKQAVLHLMRVAVLYKNELRYAPKAMFYAGRAFDAIGGPEDADRAQRLYLETYRSFKGTNWATEARAFIKRR